MKAMDQHEVSTRKVGRPQTLSRGAWILAAAVAVAVMSGCLAAAAGGAGYVVGHEVADDD